MLHRSWGARLRTFISLGPLNNIPTHILKLVFGRDLVVLKISALSNVMILFLDITRDKAIYLSRIWLTDLHNLLVLATKWTTTYHYITLWHDSRETCTYIVSPSRLLGRLNHQSIMSFWSWYKLLCLMHHFSPKKLLNDQTNVIFVIHGHFAIDWYELYCHIRKYLFLTFERLDRPKRPLCGGR